MLLPGLISGRECIGSGRRNNPEDDICGQASYRPIYDRPCSRSLFHLAKMRNCDASSCHWGSVCSEEHWHRDAYDDAHRCGTAISQINARTPQPALHMNKKTLFAQKGYTRVAHICAASRI